LETVAEATPPDDMWTRIAEKMTRRESALDCLRRKVRLSFPWVSLVQATVISSLLLGFVAGVEDQVCLFAGQAPLAFGVQTATVSTLTDRRSLESKVADGARAGTRLDATGAALAPSTRGPVTGHEGERAKSPAWRDVILAD
jgi:hypothetical protein